jgi:hypothetical protein
MSKVTSTIISSAILLFTFCYQTQQFSFHEKQKSDLEVLHHPLYSPILAQNDYLFGPLKKKQQIDNRPFKSDFGVMDARRK